MVNWQAIQATTETAAVLFAAVAAGFSWWTNRLVQKQLREEIRPQLVMFYRKKRRLFAVRNVGRETAMNPKIKILTQPAGTGKKAARLLEAVAMPTTDEKPICFYVSKADGGTSLLGLDPQDQRIHTIFNPTGDSAIRYKMLITYEDISGENTYSSLFETIPNGVRHISTRRLGKDKSRLEVNGEHECYG